MNFLKILIVAVVVQIATATFAQNHIVIGVESKVFETPMAKDEYAATNEADEPVLLQPGMVFAVKEQKGGWYVIEYSPGLRGMVMQNVVADKSKLKSPVAGSYKVFNQAGKNVNVVVTDGKWTLNAGGKNYTGQSDGASVIFADEAGNEAFSLTNIDGTPLLFTYDNNVTHYF